MLEYLLPHFIVIVALMMFRSGGNLHSNAAPDRPRPRPTLRRPALELTIKSGPDAAGGQPPTSLSYTVAIRFVRIDFVG